MSPETPGRSLAVRWEDALLATAGVPEIEAVRDELVSLVEDARDATSFDVANAVVCLVGPTGAGKSTLLNALVGAPIATPGIDRPTTAAPVVYAPAGLSDGRVGTWRDHPQLGDVRIASYDRVAGAPWQGQVLIDTPDVNSVADVHRDRARVLAQTADVLVVVLHRQAVVEASTATFVDAWTERRRIVWVLGHADTLTDVDRETLRAQIAQRARDRWSVPAPEVYVVDSAAAARGQGGPEFARLVEALERLGAADSAASVRRERVDGLARVMARHIAPVDEAVRKRLVAWRQARAEGIAGLGARVRLGLQQRIDGRTADLRILVAQPLTEAWWGPGGWVLRLGTLAAMGAGAGAWLARRSLLGGAAVAASAALADQTLQRGRRERWMTGEGVAPSPDELTRWARDALLPAHTRTRDLGDAMQQASAKTTEHVAARIGRAVTDVWGPAWRRALAHKPSSWLLAALPILDAPIFLLLGWVVYRVGDGYLEGAYEGLPLLVDTALLAGVWLVVERLLAAALVRWRSRGVKRRVLAEIDQAVAAALSEAGDPATEAADALDAALAVWRERD